jgi:hypothetical protein
MTQTLLFKELKAYSAQASAVVDAGAGAGAGETGWCKQMIRSIICVLYDIGNMQYST